MKHKIKTVLLFIFMPALIFSQNYRLINPSKVATFTRIDSIEYENYFLFSKVDSSEVIGEDTVYYFNRILDTTESPICLHDTISFGEKVIIKNDTDVTHVFFNFEGDSIFVKTKLFVGESWQLYKFADNSYVKATVINKLYGGILPNIFDSLFRIKLNVYDESGVLLTDVFPNETKMDITQNYGIVEFWPFHEFPNEEDALILVGLTDPDTNYVDVTSTNTFDFSLGHEFHIEETLQEGDDRIYTLTKHFILGRDEFIDHIEYTVFRVVWQETQNASGSDTLRIIDTVYIVYNYSDFEFLDTIELKTFQKINFGFSDWIQGDSIYAGIPYKVIYDWFDLDDTNACLENPLSNTFPEESYGQGLGLIHYFDSTSASEYYRYDLVYFQKGLRQWGSEINFNDLGFVNINTIIPSINMQTFPNPVTNNLNIYCESLRNKPVELEIYNAYGQIVLHEELYFDSDGNCKLSMNMLKQGYYFLRVHSMEFSLTKKIVKL